MKKFWKFVGGIASMAAVAFGAYCVYKKVAAKKEEDFDEFDDCFEEENEETDSMDREYVSINITSEEPEESKESAEPEAKEESEPEVKEDTEA